MAVYIELNESSNCASPDPEALKRLKMGPELGPMIVGNTMIKNMLRVRLDDETIKSVIKIAIEDLGVPVQIGLDRQDLLPSPSADFSASSNPSSPMV